MAIVGLLALFNGPLWSDLNNKDEDEDDYDCGRREAHYLGL